jgi:hypothetical protein
LGNKEEGLFKRRVQKNDAIRLESSRLLASPIPSVDSEGESLACGKGHAKRRLRPSDFKWHNGGDQRLATLDFPSEPILSRVCCIAWFADAQRACAWAFTKRGF